MLGSSSDDSNTSSPDSVSNVEHSKLSKMQTEGENKENSGVEMKEASVVSPSTWQSLKPKKKRRGNLPKPATNLFKRWLFDHLV